MPKIAPTEGLQVILGFEDLSLIEIFGSDLYYYSYMVLFSFVSEYGN